MLRIDKSSWHARAYLWWYAEKHYTGLARPDLKNVNLCPYVRTVLLYAPLRWLFNSGGYVWRCATWGALVGLLHLSLWRLGKEPLDALLTLELVILIVAGIIGMGIGIWFLGSKIGEKVIDAEGLEPMRSFGRVLGARLEAAHSNICPVMEFVDTQEGAQDERGTGEEAAG